jgi:hypothetical protein
MTQSATYKPRSTKRKRRTKAEIQRLEQQLYDLLESIHPMTVRQVFYRMVVAELIAKEEKEYHNTICRLLVRMRRRGDLPFDWISDNTRWMRKPRTYSSMEQALKDTARAYRRALWDEQDVYVEIWTEKGRPGRCAAGGNGPLGRTLDGFPRLLQHHLSVRGGRGH